MSSKSSSSEVSPDDARKAADSAAETSLGEPRPRLPGPGPDEHDPWLGRVLDERYRVIERIGQGGMGTVYVAEHLALHKQVALKLVHEVADSSHAQRFVREAMVTSLIDHPNVISAIDFGTFQNGTAYLAMQLVRGPTLGKVLSTEGVLTWARTADIGAQIADALCAAQTQGIVHRDLKPDNIILQQLHDGSELVKLLDFGIAKHARDSLAPPPMQSTQQVTRIGVVIGTLGYMAPEQAVGKRADHRSDLYALGAILWECVVGRRLWSFDDVQALLAEQLNRAPRTVREMAGDSSMPDAFDQMIKRLLEINPMNRPQSPAEVRDGLRELVARVKAGELVSLPREKGAPNTGEQQAATRVRRNQDLLFARPKADHDDSRAQPTQSEISIPPIGIEALPAPAMLPNFSMNVAPPAPNTSPAPPMPQMIEIKMPRAPRVPKLDAILPISSAPPMAAAPAAAPQPTRVLGRQVALPAPAQQPPAAAVTEGAAPLPSGRPSRMSLHTLPPRATLVRFAVLGAVAVFALAWFARGALFPAPARLPPAKPKAESVVASAKPELGDDVRPLMKSLVEGASREERVSAAQQLLVHVPVDEVPAYGRAMAHLQLAETCPQKKEQLATMASVDDPRVLPVLITLGQRKRTGCGPRAKEDCLACLRSELDGLIARFEKAQMTGKKP